MSLMIQELTTTTRFHLNHVHSERAELGLEGEEAEEADEMLDENLETLHPNKMRRTHSRNGDLLGDQVWIN